MLDLSYSYIAAIPIALVTAYIVWYASRSVRSLHKDGELSRRESALDSLAMRCISSAEDSWGRANISRVFDRQFHRWAEITAEWPTGFAIRFTLDDIDYDVQERVGSKWVSQWDASPTFKPLSREDPQVLIALFDQIMAAHGIKN